ncbi:choice-of-anchor I family protein [Roseofilum casamattae]|uniref:Choice-of-anchor I family protein n=1 Tax=Roseofilum casamattae BLCC-M143 TaxID=3022442 RepID=A0ABT7BV34_9CYAN|nr:choice-of-anchor I family protein [Roseofilum casamattae]MDJ1183056.1 choice-of-anchor I family protein [Roseofilum casamattae BLCC-M143]
MYQWQTLKSWVRNLVGTSLVSTLSLFISAEVGSALSLKPIGTYTTGIFDESAAEIIAYDPGTRRLFVTNGAKNQLDILDITDPTQPRLRAAIDLNPYGGGVNSVAVSNGKVAIAIEAKVKQDPGTILFLDSNGRRLNSVKVGALPDMVTFTPDGEKLLVANEGEPNSYDRADSVDPEGSVSIIDLRTGRVTTAEFDGVPMEGHVRIFGPNASVAQDLEPEYITVSADSRTAWVTLQENNAIAILDITTGRFQKVVGLGYKNHSLPRNGLDASDKDNTINIANWPVFGMYQPDSIASYDVNGKTYLVTANEGDSREYDGFVEEERVKDLDPTAFPAAQGLQDDVALGRLIVTNTIGDRNADPRAIYSFGARSFSIWDSNGKLVFDSQDALEQLTAQYFPDFFNSNHSENKLESRSDNKGPEPEALTLGRIGDRTLAFVGLERIGGIVVYDISNPQTPRFLEYANNRDFAGDPEAGNAGDLGPEGLVFIPGTDSPIGQPLLVATNEVSGTTTVYAIAVD